MYTKTRSFCLRPALDNIIMVHSFLATLEYTVSICFCHFRSSVTWMPNNFDWPTLSISSPSMVISGGKTGFLLKHIISSLVFWGIHFHIVFFGPFWNIISYCLHVTDWRQHPFLELSFSWLLNDLRCSRVIHIFDCRDVYLKVIYLSDEEKRSKFGSLWHTSIKSILHESVWPHIIWQCSVSFNNGTHWFILVGQCLKPFYMIVYSVPFSMTEFSLLWFNLVWSLVMELFGPLVSFF